MSEWIFGFDINRNTLENFLPDLGAFVVIEKKKLDSRTYSKKMSQPRSVSGSLTSNSMRGFYLTVLLQGRAVRGRRDWVETCPEDGPMTRGPVPLP